MRVIARKKIVSSKTSDRKWEQYAPYTFIGFPDRRWLLEVHESYKISHPLVLKWLYETVTATCDKFIKYIKSSTDNRKFQVDTCLIHWDQISRWQMTRPCPCYQTVTSRPRHARRHARHVIDITVVTSRHKSDNMTRNLNENVWRCAEKNLNKNEKYTIEKCS